MPLTPGIFFSDSDCLTKNYAGDPPIFCLQSSLSCSGFLPCECANHLPTLLLFLLPIHKMLNTQSNTCWWSVRPNSHQLLYSDTEKMIFFFASPFARKNMLCSPYYTRFFFFSDAAVFFFWYLCSLFPCMCSAVWLLWPIFSSHFFFCQRRFLSFRAACAGVRKSPRDGGEKGKPIK